MKMSAKVENKVRQKLQEKMYDLLSYLDDITEGCHPTWDKDFSDEMTEVIISLIKVGNLSEVEK